MVTKRAARQRVTALPARRLFTADEYQRMGVAGVFRPDERLELLEGVIVCMSPIGARHQRWVDWLARWFHLRVGDVAIVRTQGSFRMNDGSEPQPDLLLLRYRDDFYGAAPPGPKDVLLLIEVSDTTLRFDHDTKLPLYAAAGIVEVWIADVERERVLVYRAPQDGKYTQQTIVRRGGTLTPAAFPDLILPLNDLLGPRL